MPSLVLALAMSVIACATEPSRIVVPQFVCPAIIQYSPEFLKQAADALNQLSKDNPIHILMQDYQQERDKLRICQQGV